MSELQLLTAQYCGLLLSRLSLLSLADIYCNNPTIKYFISSLFSHIAGCLYH